MSNEDLPFATLQPGDGEVVMLCPHRDEQPHHMLHIAEDVPLEPCEEPGCPGIGHWYACCGACLGEVQTRGALQIASHARWLGDEPEFRLPREETSN